MTARVLLYLECVTVYYIIYLNTLLTSYYLLDRQLRVVLAGKIMKVRLLTCLNWYAPENHIKYVFNVNHISIWLM